METEDIFYRKCECVYVILHDGQHHFMFTAHGKDGRYRIHDNSSEKMHPNLLKKNILQLSDQGFIKTSGHIDKSGRYFIEDGFETETISEEITEMVFDLSKIKSQDSFWF